MIPNNLPYYKFRRSQVSVDDMTWFDFIIGEFTGVKWWNRDDTDFLDIDPNRYQPVPFPEEYTRLHRRFLHSAKTVSYFNEMADNNICNFGKEPAFYIDEMCRFDLWTLYNYPNGDVELDCGGTMRIDALPQQNEIDDVPSLNDPVPNDVPLIFGPALSLPERPFGR
jgi:hypothetical protein